MTAQCCDLQHEQAVTRRAGPWTPRQLLRNIGHAAERMYNLKTQRAELLGRAVALNSKRLCDE